MDGARDVMVFSGALTANHNARLEWEQWHRKPEGKPAEPMPTTIRWNPLPGPGWPLPA